MVKLVNNFQPPVDTSQDFLSQADVDALIRGVSREDQWTPADYHVYGSTTFNGSDIYIIHAQSDQLLEYLRSNTAAAQLNERENTFVVSDVSMTYIRLKYTDEDKFCD